MDITGVTHHWSLPRGARHTNILHVYMVWTKSKLVGGGGRQMTRECPCVFIVLQLRMPQLMSDYILDMPFIDN